jgi:hypothetical protein
MLGQNRIVELGQQISLVLFFIARVEQAGAGVAQGAGPADLAQTDLPRRFTVVEANQRAGLALMTPLSE